MGLDKDLEEFVKSTDGLGRTALKKLRNQTRGGDNNEKGGRHECYFATYQLAKRFPRALVSSLTIAKQAEGFVDDLVVIDLSLSDKRSYQLKDSLSVSWRGKKGILGYFSHQKVIDEKFHKMPDAKTVLVLANEQVYNKLSASVPSEIKAHTEVIYFQNAESPNRLLLSNSDFRNAIEGLCVSKDLDKLEVVVQGLVGAWCVHSSTMSDLEKIVRKAIEQTKPDVFRDFQEDCIVINPEFIRIVDRIKGLRYQVTHGIFNYSVGNFSGYIPYRVNSREFEQLCERVIDCQPTLAIELARVLMGAGE